MQHFPQQQLNVDHTATDYFKEEKLLVDSISCVKIYSFEVAAAVNFFFNFWGKKKKTIPAFISNWLLKVNLYGQTWYT